MGDRVVAVIHQGVTPRPESGDRFAEFGTVIAASTGVTPALTQAVILCNSSFIVATA